MWLQKDLLPGGTPLTSLIYNQERILVFPATLVRKEPTTPHRESGALTFSLHQVAYALFPQHFARMYGYETITHGPEVMVEVGGMLDYRPINVFYMEKLPIPADHFIYTNHTRPNSWGAKENYCQCPQCAGHQQVHEEQRRAMSQEVGKLRKAGIFVPFDDPTDWCVVHDDTYGNRVVFFEVEHICPDCVAHHATQLPVGYRGEVYSHIETIRRHQTYGDDPIFNHRCVRRAGEYA